MNTITYIHPLASLVAGLINSNHSMFAESLIQSSVSLQIWAGLCIKARPEYRGLTVGSVCVVVCRNANSK